MSTPQEKYFSDTLGVRIIGHLMANSEAKNEGNKRYKERHPEKVKEWWQRQEESRGHRDRAAYFREYRRRKKLESTQPDTPTNP